MNRDESIAKNKELNDDIALDIQHLFGSARGIRVLDHLSQFCGYQISSVDQEYDPNRVMFREGQRNVYVHINNMLKREVKKND